MGTCSVDSSRVDDSVVAGERELLKGSFEHRLAISTIRERTGCEGGLGDTMPAPPALPPRPLPPVPSPPPPGCAAGVARGSSRCVGAGSLFKSGDGGLLGMALSLGTWLAPPPPTPLAPAQLGVSIGLAAGLGDGTSVAVLPGALPEAACLGGAPGIRESGADEPGVGTGLLATNAAGAPPGTSGTARTSGDPPRGGTLVGDFPLGDTFPPVLTALEPSLPALCRAGAAVWAATSSSGSTCTALAPVDAPGAAAAVGGSIPGPAPPLREALKRQRALVESR